ncbi:C39 family peptidase [Bacterioplanoides sp.]|uniref:C39 family peptidase n=1 Tax=Bacterioplanoides sp. TaxID=2066072 RepID=UPI003AFFDEBF
MFIILLGSIIAFAMVNEFSIVPDREQGDTYIRVAVGQDGQHDQLVNVEPLSVQKFNNVVRQAYDYSCGSAALTTLLDYYLGRNFQERQVMEGLLRFGETERIVQRRGFSLLDMKRLVTALGHPSGGFKAEASDLEELDHPAIAPIEYAGFKHFVVIRTVYEGRVYVADPALGNISFTMSRFLEVWDNNVLFIVFPNGHKPASGLELREEDMRYVSDYIIAENTYKEFPFFQIRYEDLITNQIAQLWNNARSTLQVVRDENGDEVLNEDGDPVLEYNIETEADGLSQEEFNIRFNTTVPYERIEKTLRFRRK